jgi:CheY-like chemotaxis protein
MNSTIAFQNLADLMPARIAHFRIARSTRPSREKLRVLLVEDQVFSQKLMQEMLRLNYILDTASTAHDGFRLFLENAHDVVFLDIELDDDSGHSLGRVIRTLDPEVYVVMVTANNSVEDVALAKANKVDGFIVKPYNRQKVFECLETYASRKNAGQVKGNKS